MIGGICWYCYWGWPEQVADIYLRALKKLNGYDFPLLFGPSHLVWEDENFHSVEWCIEHFKDYEYNFSEKELEIVMESLQELAKLPLNIRCVEPEDYAGENPELYPPPDGVRMIKV